MRGTAEVKCLEGEVFDGERRRGGGRVGEVKAG